MKLRSRFSTTGSAGAVFFIGSVALSGYFYVSMMEGVARGRFEPGLATQPMLYVALTTIGALGIAMMLGGREIVSDDVIEQERLEAAAKRKP
ncbi:hypothetical protein CEW88_15590 [Alloyangia pacifica]|uniref:Uncharacterized protein n=1 Tax=Alloyangia pacifica TaxID=311180 RepID=A0A2U8HHS2_9RHOB|nr:hypothetical protein [Alloyangia pacifica]AWI85170.1 hypothetical protein CEW88_15590 [Alloyangia pacifica]